MGNPKTFKKGYTKPSHPWEGNRIKEEGELIKEYGLRRKKELWKASTILDKFKSQAKTLSASQGEQVEKETKQLLDHLKSYGMVKEDATFDDVLGLDIKNVLDRRLQSILFSKNMAKSMNQARQMITHRHVSVGGKTITSPSYMVKVGEEDNINFTESSSFNNPEHPELKTPEQEQAERGEEEVTEQKATPESESTESKEGDNKK